MKKAKEKTLAGKKITIKNKEGNVQEAKVMYINKDYMGLLFKGKETVSYGHDINKIVEVLHAQ